MKIEVPDIRSLDLYRRDRPNVFAIQREPLRGMALGLLRTSNDEKGGCEALQVDGGGGEVGSDLHVGWDTAKRRGLTASSARRANRSPAEVLPHQPFRLLQCFLLRHHLLERRRIAGDADHRVVHRDALDDGPQIRLAEPTAPVRMFSHLGLPLSAQDIGSINAAAKDAGVPGLG